MVHRVLLAARLLLLTLTCTIEASDSKQLNIQRQKCHITLWYFILNISGAVMTL